MFKRGRNRPFKLSGTASGNDVTAQMCGFITVVATLLTLSCILLGAFISYPKNHNEDHNTIGSLEAEKTQSHGIGPALQPKPTLEYVNGTELIWEKPPNSAKAVLFLAHGCGGKAGNFWNKSPACPHCVGLPEETRIVHDALARGFTVLTASSKGNCWSHGKEMIMVRDAIKQWVDKNGLSNVPLVAMGASSGGYFVSVLANEKDLRFSSIVIMIAEGLFGLMEDVIREDYPPTLFIHMPKDQRRNALIRINVDWLRKKGIEAEEVQCLEFPLTPHFFGDQIEGIDRATSVGLYKLMREKGFVDSNGYMKKDGRRTPWVKALKESKLQFPYGKVSKQHVQEELNLAFAYHEMTSLPSKQMFGWFESHMRRAEG